MIETTRSSKLLIRIGAKASLILSKPYERRDRREENPRDESARRNCQLRFRWFRFYNKRSSNILLMIYDHSQCMYSNNEIMKSNADMKLWVEVSERLYTITEKPIHVA